MKTIYQLRKEGYKIRVTISRYYKNGIFASNFEARQIGHDTKYLSGKGGKTMIELTTPNGKTLTGESYCSKNDNFCRKIGNSIALGRILKQLEIQ